VLATLEKAKAGQPFDHEYRITRPDGSIRWIWDRWFPIQDKTMKVIRYVGVASDITERKQAEEALYRRELELRTALSEIQTMKDQLEVENLYFRQEIKRRHQFDHILGQSDGLKYVLYRAEQVAPMNTTVLILGEIGTGKGLIAAAIHDMSPRKDRPMITVNCAALPAGLIESELFGREKGADHVHSLSSTVRTLEETERKQILKILSETRWRIEGNDGAATILGLHPSTLRARMHKLGILRGETKEPD